MLQVRNFLIFSVVATTLTLTSCNAPATADTKTTAVQTEANKMATSPEIEIAPQEYATLAEATIQKNASHDYDGWGAMLADDVEFYYPDGDQDTRTKIIGKQSLLTWVKKADISSGIKSSTISAFNTVPLKINKKMNAGALNGFQVICFYTSNTSYNNGKSVSVRHNAVYHFNDNKLIDRIYNYYDRTPYIKIAGKNILDVAKK